MANLTVAIDGELLKLARIRAIEEETSVNAVVRDYLEDYVARDLRAEKDAPMKAFLDWANTVHAGSGSRGRTWTRDELYER